MIIFDKRFRCFMMFLLCDYDVDPPTTTTGPQGGAGYGPRPCPKWVWATLEHIYKHLRHYKAYVSHISTSTSTIIEYLKYLLYM